MNRASFRNEESRQQENWRNDLARSNSLVRADYLRHLLHDQRMRLTEWQQKKSLVKAAQTLQNDEVFTLLMGMLEEESPLNLPLPSQGVQSDDRSYRLGLIEGYNQCLKNIRATWAGPPNLPKPLKSTFEPPE